MELASTQAMERERERLGLARPEGPASADADHLDLDQKAARIDRLAASIAHLRDAIIADPRAVVRGDTVVGVADTATPSRTGQERVRAARRTDRARVRTCPVCAQVLDALFDFLSHFQYALATDPGTQASFRAAGGFCALHAWQLGELSSPRGLSGGYPSLLEGAAETLRALVGRSAGEAARSVRAMATAGPGCGACKARSDAEEEAVSALCADLATEAGRVQHETSHGLCLRHLALILPRVTPGAVPFLLRHQSRRCVEVAEGLAGYALKFDAHRQDLLSREEETAHRQAIVLTAGERGVF
jgi:hypothetical protein